MKEVSAAVHAALKSSEHMQKLADAEKKSVSNATAKASTVTAHVSKVTLEGVVRGLQAHGVALKSWSGAEELGKPLPLTEPAIVRVTHILQSTSSEGPRSELQSECDAFRTVFEGDKKIHESRSGRAQQPLNAAATKELETGIAKLVGDEAYAQILGKSEGTFQAALFGFAAGAAQEAPRYNLYAEAK
eukprot:2520628-Amphidinium_carterae.1